MPKEDEPIIVRPPVARGPIVVECRVPSDDESPEPSKPVPTSPKSSFVAVSL